MAKAEYECLEPFYIDDGELDGVRPQQCFVLGYEFCKVEKLADTGRAFECPIINEGNRERLEKLLTRRGRQFDFTDDVPGDGWISLSVEAM